MELETKRFTSELNFLNNLPDPHTQKASELFDKPIDSINEEERRLAKTINFGVMYGGINYVCQGTTNPDIFDKITKESL